MIAIRGLDRGPGALFDEEMVCDRDEEGAGRKGDERVGVGLVVSWHSVDFDEFGVARLGPWRITFCADGHGSNNALREVSIASFWDLYADLMVLPTPGIMFLGFPNMLLAFTALSSRQVPVAGTLCTNAGRPN